MEKPVNQIAIEDWLQIVRGEFSEVPGLHLTTAQAQRLWGLDATTCESILEALVQAGFLRRTRGGFARAEHGR
jgi:hypothetical protein